MIPRLFGMKAAVPLVALALAGITACSAHTTAKAAPAAPASSAPASSPTVLSDADRTTSNLACFSWTTYDRAQKIGESDAALTRYATTAQQAAVNMTDERWSSVAQMEPHEAMRTLGELCRGIHYKDISAG